VEIAELFAEIPNLFLASDYVKTNTDVACMEAANEAARRAVNALLDREGSSAGPGFRVAAEGARGAPTVHRLRPFAIPSRVGTRRLEADLVGKGYRPVVWINGPFADKLKFGSTCKSQGFVDLPQVVNLRLLHRDEPRRLNRADRLEPRYRKS